MAYNLTRVRNFWEVFASSARRFPGNVAVEVQRSTGLEQVTYDELQRMAEAIAAGLAGRGVAAGDRCAILADNDARWCAVYLAVLRLGAIAVPLDTSYTQAQVATVLTAAGARLLVAGTRLLPRAAPAVAGAGGLLVAMYEATGASGELADPRLLTVDALLRAPSLPLPPCPAGRDDAAVILYTSGTTADPKGVVLTHGNLDAERAAAFAVVDVSEQDAVLGVLPLFHSLAQMANLLLPFAVGARVVYLETLNTTDLLDALARAAHHHLCLRAAVLLPDPSEGHRRSGPGRLAETEDLPRPLALTLALRKVGLNLGPTVFARVHRVLGGHMRLLVTGGSKFDPAVGRDLYGLGFSIIQAYGLTETSGAATINQPHEAHLDTVGRILPGNELKVMPPEGDAEDGEIAIRGPIVMQGYYNRPDATAEVMRDGWFLTGDLGRLDPAGRLTITGRKKEIIVLASGKNIHPDEIERHYAASPVIKEVCVMGVTRPDEPTTERLHAVVVPDADVLRARKIVNAGDLLRFEMEGLGAGLPAHKRVLGYDLWFEPLPRTTTGKLRRHEIQAAARGARAGPGRRRGAAGDRGRRRMERRAACRRGAGTGEAARPARRHGAARRQPRTRSRSRQHGAGRAAHRTGAALRRDRRPRGGAPDPHRAPAGGGRASGRGCWRDRAGGRRLGHDSARSAARDRPGPGAAAQEAAPLGAARVAHLPRRQAVPGPGRGGGAGAPAGDRPVPDLPESPGLSRSVPVVRRAAAGHVPADVRGRRRRVLRDAADARAGAARSISCR